MSPADSKVLDRRTAQGYLVINLVVWPGAGSVLAGRRVGYAQAAISFSGMALSLYFLWGTLGEWWVRREVVVPELNIVVAGLMGLGLIGISWVWSLWTSLAVLRAAGKVPGEVVSSERP